MPGCFIDSNKHSMVRLGGSTYRTRKSLKHKSIIIMVLPPLEQGQSIGDYKENDDLCSLFNPEGDVTVKNSMQTSLCSPAH